MKTPIVLVSQFIRAIRDAGYRGTPSAVAELVDNAFEANADTVTVQVLPKLESLEEGPVILVQDNGVGMTPSVLKTALQFGGSFYL